MTYTEFLEKLEPLQAELINALDIEFIEYLGMTRKMRYKIPFYDYGRWICYLNPIKNAHVDLCFLDGRSLANIFPILDMKNRKKVSSMRLSIKEDIPPEVSIIVKEAIRMKNNTH